MRNLLHRPGPAGLESLEKALAAAAGAFPVPRGHLNDLPYAVRDLSRLLTTERGGLARSYWSHPRLVAAYVRYFLPWNMYRLSWLLPSLDLPLAEGAEILDLGSGPLTLPLALWCARPDLRGLPLSFTCCDVSLQPLEIGKRIFERLAGPDGPWSFRLLRVSLEAALAASAPHPVVASAASTSSPAAALADPARSSAPAFAQSPEAFPDAANPAAPAREPGAGRALRRRDRDARAYSCIMAGNVLNELPQTRDSSMEERLERIMSLAHARLAPGGLLLLVEPGTRLGGKVIALSRAGALRRGFAPLAPCPHSGPCPMIAQEAYHPASPPYTGWCHFIHPADSAPRALVALGAKARLDKESLAVSCLLLQKPGATESGPHGSGLRSGQGSARVRHHAAPEPGNQAEESADDLESLEALYNEIMEEDRQASRGRASTGRSTHPGRDAMRPEDAAAPFSAARFSGAGRPAAGAFSGSVPASNLPAAPAGEYGGARIISDLIRLPLHEEPGRYACCERGLALVLDAARLPSGGAVRVRWPRHEERDEKTGALLLRHTARERKMEPEDRPAPPDLRPARNSAGDPKSVGRTARRSRQEGAGRVERRDRPENEEAAKRNKGVQREGGAKGGAENSSGQRRERKGARSGGDPARGKE